MNIVLVCNAENRRVAMFCDAVKRLRFPDVRVLDYVDILDGRISVSDYLNPSTLLRIESPGEKFETEKRLIAMGAESEYHGRAERVTRKDALLLTPDHGRIRFLKQWYLGFNELLQRLANDVANSGCQVFNSPASISLMFDKAGCHELFRNYAIPAPKQVFQVQTYDEFREALRHCPYKRVFVKPAHGSSASGVLAYRMQGDNEELFTPVELVGNGNEYRLYNALKLKRYIDHDQVRTLLDFILAEGAVIEEWIPKETMQSRFFDVRVVVINGKARAVLPRLSNGPITNLHLGNERGSLTQLKMLMDEQYNELVECAEVALSTVDGAFYAGVDVLVTAGSRNPRVLELNAFGDLLPGLTTDDGDDLYTCALKELMYAG